MSAASLIEAVSAAECFSLNGACELAAAELAAADEIKAIGPVKSLVKFSI